MVATEFYVSIDNTRTHGLYYQNIYASQLWCAKYKGICLYELNGYLRFSFGVDTPFTLFTVLSFVLDKNTACWRRQNEIALGDYWIPAGVHQ